MAVPDAQRWPRLRGQPLASRVAPRPRRQRPRELPSSAHSEFAHVGDRPVEPVGEQRCRPLLRSQEPDVLDGRRQGQVLVVVPVTPMATPRFVRSLDDAEEPAHSQTVGAADSSGIGPNVTTKTAAEGMGASCNVLPIAVPPCCDPRPVVCSRRRRGASRRDVSAAQRMPGVPIMRHRPAPAWPRHLHASG